MEVRQHQSRQRQGHLLGPNWSLQQLMVSCGYVFTSHLFCMHRFPASQTRVAHFNSLFPQLSVWALFCLTKDVVLLLSPGCLHFQDHWAVLLLLISLKAPAPAWKIQKLWPFMHDFKGGDSNKDFNSQIHTPCGDYAVNYKLWKEVVCLRFLSFWSSFRWSVYLKSTKCYWCVIQNIIIT